MFTIIFLAGLMAGILSYYKRQKPTNSDISTQIIDNSDQIAAIDRQIDDYKLELEYLKKLDSYLPEETSLDSEKQTRQRLTIQRQIRTVNHKIQSLYDKKEKLE